jgi:hypothetical protein
VPVAAQEVCEAQQASRAHLDVLAEVSVRHGGSFVPTL